LKVNRCQIEILDGVVPIVDKPMSPEDGYLDEQVGSLQKFRVTTTDDLDHVFGLITWPNARPEVRSVEFVDGLSKYKRLEGAGRWSFIPVGSGQWLGELNIMKYNGKERPTLCRPTSEELNHLAGGDAQTLFLHNGAIKLGTREALTGDQTRQRNSPALLVAEGDVKAIAAAFAVTRVMAIMYELGLEDV
jgi:hypothetical protein